MTSKMRPAHDERLHAVVSDVLNPLRDGAHPLQKLELDCCSMRPMLAVNGVEDDPRMLLTIILACDTMITVEDVLALARTFDVETTDVILSSVSLAGGPDPDPQMVIHLAVDADLLRSLMWPRPKLTLVS